MKNLPEQLTHLWLWKPLARWLPWGGDTAHFDDAKLLFFQSVATQHYIDNFAEGVERWGKAWRDYSAQSRSHVSHNDILLDVLAANLKFMAKDYDAAIPLYESAIQAIEPRRNRLRKGATLRARGSDLDYCNLVLAILRYNLAMAKKNQGRDLEDTITILKCAIEEDLPDWVVLYRGLGDVYVEQKQWEDAEKAYRDAYRITDNEEDYLNNLTYIRDRQERAGDRFVELHKEADAMRAYSAALILMERWKGTRDDRDVEARLRSKIGLLLLEERSSREGEVSIERAVSLWQDGGETNPYLRVVQATSDLLNGPVRRATLRAYLEDLRSRMKQPATRRSLQDALLDLYSLYAEEISSDFQAPDRPAMLTRYPGVTPIAIEMDVQMVPEEDQSPILTDFIPNMRKLLEEQYGLRIPGVLIQGNDTNAFRNKYVIMINEVSLASGTVSLEKKLFTDAKARLLEHDITGEETVLPGSDELAYWIGPEDWERATRAGLELLHPLEYPTRHLQALLPQFLPLFCGHQEIAAYLKGIQFERISNICDSQETLGALTATIKALLEERVPIVEFRAIAQEFARRWAQTGDLAAVVAGIRLLPIIRLQLWGNNWRYSFYRLSTNFEAALARHLQCVSRIPMLAMEPADLSDALLAIGARVAGQKKPALVTQEGSLRPVLRKLISPELPDLPVLSYAELCPAFTSMIKGDIEL